MNDLESHLLKKGFELDDTGGGFNAYRKDLNDNTYILITKKDDPSAPSDINEEVTIGYYDVETDNLIRTEYHNLKDFLNGKS